MSALTIIEHLHVFENIKHSLLPGLIGSVMNLLRLEAVEPAFCRRMLASLTLTGSQQFPFRLIEHTIPCLASSFW